MLDELLDEYRERFGDAFPLMCCMDMTDAEIADRVRGCLERGEPFKPKDGVVY